MTGYTRQSAAQIVDAATIEAVDINNEYNALDAAFNGSTGHEHDGTTGDAPQISLTAAVTGTLPIANGGTNATTEAAARTNLAVPGLATSNAFTGDLNQFTADADATNDAIVEIHDTATASASDDGVLRIDTTSTVTDWTGLYLYRTADADDNTIQIKFSGDDSAANATDYGVLSVTTDDVTNLTEDSTITLKNLVAGTQTDALILTAGATLAGATGGDQGAGTINSKGLFKDGVEAPMEADNNAWAGTNSFAVATTFNGTSDFNANITIDAEVALTESADSTNNAIFIINDTSTSTKSSDGVAKITSLSTVTTWEPLYLERQSASAGDDIQISLAAENSVNTSTVFGGLRVDLTDITDASEDSVIELHTMNAGAFANRFSIGQGIFVGSASGGDQGAGTINATELYNDGVAVPMEATNNTWTGTNTFSNTVDLDGVVTFGSTITSIATTGATSGDQGSGTINATSVYKNGVAYPALADTQTWTGTNTFQDNPASTAVVTIDHTGTEPGAATTTGILEVTGDWTADSNALALVNTDSTTASDINIVFVHDNSSSAATRFGYITLSADDLTASSEDSSFSFGTVQGGSLASRVIIDNGMYMAGATGGDQGANTFNATSIFSEGDVVPSVIDSPAWTGQHTITRSQSTTGARALRLEHTGTGTEPPTSTSQGLLECWFNTSATATPIRAITMYNQDNTTGVEYGITWDQENSVGSPTRMAEIMYIADDLTTGTEDAQLNFSTTSAGTLTLRATFRTGFVVGNPTGGDKGSGTINATGVYDDNVLLTCYPIEFEKTGAIDVVTWDTFVGDRELEDGTKVPQTHDKARAFAEDPDIADLFDPDKYYEKMITEESLPAMPTKEEWVTDGRLSMGDIQQRLWETVELQAIHIKRLSDRIAVLESPGP